MRGLKMTRRIVLRTVLLRATGLGLIAIVLGMWAVNGRESAAQANDAQWMPRIADSGVSAAVGTGAGAATSSAQGAPLVLSGVTEREANGDAHAFELYGDFPDNANVRPIVSCDGKLMQAEIMAPPLATQINVNVEAMAAGSNCTFSLQRLSDGARSGTRSVVTTAVPTQIDGLADRGVTNGRRFVELFGSFASAAALQARVVCGARYAGGRVEFASSGQINVSMPDAGLASGCACQ